MVDLHQVEPGLPDGHPWKTYSRWNIAWRTFLGISLAGMVGVMFFGAITAKGGAMNVMESYTPYIFTVGIPLISAATAAVVGPWLKRFYPFSQALLFAAISVVVVTALFLVVSAIDWIARGACPPDTFCSSPFDGLMWAVIIFAFPTFLSTCIGYSLAIWSPTKRGSRVFWPVFGTVLLVFVAALITVAVVK